MSSKQCMAIHRSLLMLVSVVFVLNILLEQEDSKEYQHKSLITLNKFHEHFRHSKQIVIIQTKNLEWKTLRIKSSWQAGRKHGKKLKSYLYRILLLFLMTLPRMFSLCNFYLFFKKIVFLSFSLSNATINPAFLSLGLLHRPIHTCQVMKFYSVL